MQKIDEPISSIGQIEKLTQLTLNDFILSSLHDKKATYQALLSGFLLESPVIVEATVYKGRPKLELHDSFRAIGSGAMIAAFLLSLREYHPDMPLSYAVYLAYEAKRASEKTGYVGRFTTLAIQAPHVPDSTDRAHLKLMNLTGIANLDSLYRGLWKVPLVQIPEFPDDFFHSFGK